MGDALTGGCLCGAVRYEVDRPVHMMGMCHCSRCRRWLGVRYSTEIAVMREQLHLVAGEHVLRANHIAGIGWRSFCSRCGSCVWFSALHDTDRPYIGILAGTFDDDPGIRPVAHSYVASKAPWDTIAPDDLPKIIDEDMADTLAPDDHAPLAAAPLPDPPSETRAVEGGCLCGAVRYAVTGPFLRANHCHCTRCRRHSGSYGLTQGRIRPEHFALLSGAEQLTSYHESGHAAKVFCSFCGSSMFGGEWPDGTTVSIRLGSLDADPGIRPQFHTFVAAKAAWDAIDDGLPQFPGRATRDDMARLGLAPV